MEKEGMLEGRDRTKTKGLHTGGIDENNDTDLPPRVRGRGSAV